VTFSGAPFGEYTAYFFFGALFAFAIRAHDRTPFIRLYMLQHGIAVIQTVDLLLPLRQVDENNWSNSSGFGAVPISFSTRSSFDNCLLVADVVIDDEIPSTQGCGVPSRRNLGRPA
jgi:hypothetical protein